MLSACPPGYVPRKIGYNLDSIKIKVTQPIEQFISGNNGVYELTGIGKRWVNLQTFQKWTTSACYRTPNHVDYEHLERIYWGTITGTAPIYGADVEGTLTDPDVTTWNCNNLGTILNYIRDDYGLDIRGVITPFLYFAMWKTTFCWHIEDMDLYALNYIHFGYPKTWYTIPPSHGREFEALADRLFPPRAATAMPILGIKEL